LQIWVFPKERNIKPRYDQKTFDSADRQNRLQTVVSPDGKEGVAINQDAWFSMGIFNKGYKTEYQLNSNNNGVYIFVLEGDFMVNGQALNRRDGLGILNNEIISIEALSEAAEVLLMEVPMVV
jgi:redox-sensitive bicupin YhaK (pirin superfamily)